MYGLYRGIRSSRRLEEACNYRFDFKWLVHGRHIDYSTIANFRSRFREPLKDLFRQIGRLAMNLGLVRLGEVAFDATRVKASNSRYNTRTAATLEEKLRALDALYERLMNEYQAADDQAAMAGSPTHLPKELGSLEKRRQRMAAALEQARAADTARQKAGVDPRKNPAQVPLADPDSRVMPNKEGGYAPYNQRPRIAETPFGILKSVMGLRQFLLRGLGKVKNEWRWAATAFNIVKLIRGIARLRADFAVMAQTT